MSIESYFRDHWVDVSPERHEVYEQVLAWSPAWAALFERAEVGDGHVVLDLGVGPGHTAMEMARRVGPSGHVHGVDINTEFLRRTDAKAETEGFADRVTTHLVTDHVLPLGDGSVDRVIAKNTLEYVPSLADTLAECFRVTTIGGRMTATDSDWDFLIVEPWTVEDQRRFFTAGAHAFKEPNIGRKLRNAMLDAGYADIEVSVHTNIDTDGNLLGVLRNFVGYISEFETMPVGGAERMLDQLQQAVDSGRYLAVFPQFSVTGCRLE